MPHGVEVDCASGHWSAGFPRGLTAHELKDCCCRQQFRYRGNWKRDVFPIQAMLGKVRVAERSFKYDLSVLRDENSPVEVSIGRKQAEVLVEILNSPLSNYVRRRAFQQPYKCQNQSVHPEGVILLHFRGSFRCFPWLAVGELYHQLDEPARGLLAAGSDSLSSVERCSCRRMRTCTLLRSARQENCVSP